MTVLKVAGGVIVGVLGLALIGGVIGAGGGDILLVGAIGVGLVALARSTRK